MGAVQPFLSGAISQDGERAEGRDRRGDHAGLHRVVAARRQGDRRSTATAASGRSRSTRRGTRKRPRPPRRAWPRSRSAASCRTSGTRSRTSSTSPATRATSPSASTRTGMPGEIFLVMAKEGSTISGFADAFAQAISLRAAVRRAAAGPGGQVQPRPVRAVGHDAGTREIRFAKSIVDYIFRWLATKFLSPEAQFRAGVNGREDAATAGCRQPDGSAAAHAAAAQRRAGAEGSAVRGDPEPGGRAAVLDVRVDHGAQRQLLQVRQLRQHVAAARNDGTENRELRTGK